MNAPVAPHQVVQSETQLSELFVEFGRKYKINPATVPVLLQRTAFKQEEEREIPKSSMIAVLVVALAYDLNPFTREIYAFPDKNGRIVPVVGVDGWARILNGHTEFDGMTFSYSGKMKKKDGAQDCHEWVECHIYRKDRTHPVVVREYLDECYRDTVSWRAKPKRMLRHRSVIQCGRYAFGLTGIYDVEEAEYMQIDDAPLPLASEGPLSGGLAAAKVALDGGSAAAMVAGAGEAPSEFARTLPISEPLKQVNEPSEQLFEA